MQLRKLVGRFGSPGVEAGVTLGVVLRLVGLVLFVVAALGVGGRFNLVAAGLTCWVGAELAERM